MFSKTYAQMTLNLEPFKNQSIIKPSNAPRCTVSQKNTAEVFFPRRKNPHEYLTTLVGFLVSKCLPEIFNNTRKAIRFSFFWGVEGSTQCWRVNIRLTVH